MKKKPQKRNKHVEETFQVVSFFRKYHVFIIFILLLLFHIFLRFYQLEQRAILGWDQADSAWAAKSIVVDHHLLLQGVPIKGNTSISMAPLYYYLIAPFYFFTNMNPIASPIFAGIVSIFSSLVVFFVTKKIFDNHTALVALFINTFSFYIMSADRVQYAISLIVPVSYLIFYCLYQVMCGREKYLIWLAIVVGFSFSVDFTSIFYPIIILFSLPLLPRTKKTIYYILLSIPVFLLFISPLLINEFTSNSSVSSGFLQLFQSSFHGFHLRRVLQLTHDAFIGFLAPFNFNRLLDYFDFLIPITFIYFYLAKHLKRERFVFCYLLVLWIIVPWFVLATYRGELSNPYFSLAQDMAIAIFAYFTVQIFHQKYVFLRFLPLIFWGLFAFSNLQLFVKVQPGNFQVIESEVKTDVQNHQIIPFDSKDPESFVYWYYTKKAMINNGYTSVGNK